MSHNVKNTEMQTTETQKYIDKDCAFQILDRNTAWIENCDTKASIVLGGIGVIFGILLASDYVKKIYEN